MDPTNGHTDTIYHQPNVVVHGEGGMLGMAMHPDFPNTPYLYVAYEYLDGNNYTERIVRYTYANNTLQNELVLLDGITGNNNHNGCRLHIVGDKMFISTGDAENTANAQNINSLNGKILRINLDGSIPTDNPFPNDPTWSWGHRNAQGLVFQNNMLYSSEHGNTTDDEINIIRGNTNCGWPTVEGFCDTPPEMTFCSDSNIAQPIYAWTPTVAPSGMDYYNHPMYPNLQHSLLLATLKDEHLYQLKLNATRDSIVSAVPLNITSYGRLRDMCMAPDGRIFVSTSNSTSDNLHPKIDKIFEIYDPNYTGIVTTLPIIESLIVYPNPTNNNIMVNIAGGTYPMQFAIDNLLGQTLITGQLSQNGQNISLSNISTGIYLLKVVDKGGASFTSRISRL